MTAKQAKRAGWCLLPSPARLHRIYTAAREATPSQGSMGGNIESRQRFLRAVSVGFHKRLRRAKIYVEM